MANMAKDSFEDDIRELFVKGRLSMEQLRKALKADAEIRRLPETTDPDTHHDRRFPAENED
jgi:hypothetical protein